jgi:hypothetical protein
MMNQLRNWSFRLGAALCVAMSCLLVLSVSMPAHGGYGGSSCSNPCKPFSACTKAKKPKCFAVSSNKHCKCQHCAGQKHCVCLPGLPG